MPPEENGLNGHHKNKRTEPSFKDRVAETARRRGYSGLLRVQGLHCLMPGEAIDPRLRSRKIIRMVLLGMKKEVLGSEIIWLCGACYRVPRDLPSKRFNRTEVMFAIKNLAVKEGCTPPGLMVQRTLLKQHGRLYEVTEFENGKRAKLGLPPIVEHPEDYNLLLK